MMNQLFSQDIENCIHALQSYIIHEEDVLSSINASDSEWDELRPFKSTLTNLEYIKSIYG